MIGRRPGDSASNGEDDAKIKPKTKLFSRKVQKGKIEKRRAEKEGEGKAEKNDGSVAPMVGGGNLPG